MRFNCTVEGIDITIELIEREQINKSSFFKKGRTSKFDIYFTSSKNGLTMTHVSQGHQFRNDKKVLELQVPDFVEDRELIEHVLSHWGLEDREEVNKPEWSIS
ncbi:MAG: hypothetical protein KC493_08135 [Bacteriovoracaceae bacterium]|nr:hypothetical protein [Bacteriovoracaceae bacterium]